MLEDAREVRATCHGASPQPAFVPPTIFVKFPFLMSLSLLREPEQEMHLPLWALPQVFPTSGSGQQANITEI